jgi:uncharacterized membrane protein
MKPVLSMLVACAACSSTALAQSATLEFIGNFWATDMSSDGSVVVGNDQSFETTRWTVDAGAVNLGRGTFAALGRGAGAPKVSANGEKVSATILTDDGQFISPGVWDLETGWDAFMPPQPPDGGVIDLAYGSAWGISGDGLTVTGLYWRNTVEGGLAHGMRRVGTNTAEDLGSLGRDSRANAASFDGSVIAGWASNPGFGNWWACVWENGVLTTLNEDDAWTQADSINDDGTIIGGTSYDEVQVRMEATVWRKVGGVWVEELLGALPGTADPFGFVTVYGITPDGSTMVGYNRFSGPGNETGFVWTPDGGFVDVVNFLADRGVTVPTWFKIQTLTAVSDDGLIMTGAGFHTTTGVPSSFRITITPACTADWNADGALDFFDVQGFLADFAAGLSSADLNADGVLDFFDVQTFLGLFAAGC